MCPLLHVIHEDADLLVVHKPADLVCHPTKGDEYSSLISRARLYLQAATATGGPDSPEVRPHLIHRLDRETSGIVLLAKNAAAAGELGKVWETRAVRKEYLAVVHGHLADDHGIIDAPLGRDEQSPVAIKDCVRLDGHSAQTEFVVERRFHQVVKTEPTESNGMPSAPDNKPFSLLRVHPLTGRKHQIRIHLAHLGHPLVGDKLYGGRPEVYLALVERRLTPEQRAWLILPQHALHACRLTFEWRGQIREFTTPPEGVLAAFIDGQPPTALPQT
jgi:23S rRNA pseudouridine1911/1915/1917 synthase